MQWRQPIFRHGVPHAVSRSLGKAAAVSSLACAWAGSSHAEIYQWRTPTSGDVNTLTNWGINDDPNGPVPTVPPGPNDTLAISADSFTESDYTIAFTEPDTEFASLPFVGEYSALFVGRPFSVPERDTIRLLSDTSGTSLRFNNVEFGGDDAVVQHQGSPFVNFNVTTFNTDIAYDVRFSGGEANLDWRTGRLGFKANPNEGIPANLTLNGALLEVTGSDDVRLNPVGAIGQEASGFHTIYVGFLGALNIRNAGLDIDAAPRFLNATPLRIDAGFVSAQRMDLGTGRTGVIDEPTGQVRVELADRLGNFSSSLNVGSGGLTIGREVGAPVLPATSDAVLEAGTFTFLDVAGPLVVQQTGQIALQRGGYSAATTTVTGRFGLIDDGTFETDRFDLIGSGAVSLNNATLDVSGLLTVGPSTDVQASGTIIADDGFVIRGGNNNRFIGDTTIDGDVTLGLTPGFSPGGFTVFGAADVDILGDLTFDIELDPFASSPAPGRVGQVTLAGNAGLQVRGDLTGGIDIDAGPDSATFVFGRLAPGNDDVPWFTAGFEETLVLGEGSSVELETSLGLPGQYRQDAVDVDGLLVLDGTLTLATGPFDPLPPVDAPLILMEAGTLSGMFKAVEITGGSPVNPGQTLAILYTETQVLAQTALFGDADLDGQIEQGDLNAVLNNWGGSDGVSWVTGDLTQDGVVDQADLNAVLNNWGSSATPSFEGFAVPEPGLAVAAMLGLVGGCQRLRPRSNV
ncbi:MAG: hypothetical protein AAF663_02055 [Planctomycetota bacterium]